MDTILPDVKEEAPHVSSLAQEVLDLFAECDRIDTLPDDRARIRAMEALLDRVERFEADVHVEVKAAAFHEAMGQAE